MDNEQLSKQIDIETALSRLGGNRKLLDTLLKKFANDTYFTQLKNEVGAQDFAGAAKTAHALKGVAANLSITGLHKEIVTLEQQLKNGVCDENTFAAAEAAYTALISAIKQE